MSELLSAYASLWLQAVDALQGPTDLGTHHDHYLTYPHHEESGGVATA
jgi:hypothetical protein